MIKVNIIVLFVIIFILSCGLKDEKKRSTEMIVASVRQDSIFQSLLAVTNNVIPDNELNDSLAFLILPVQASCPSCRKKTIDSIVKHQKDLPDGHFIIISARMGRKSMNGYFREEGAELPAMGYRLLLDSGNLAYKYDLYSDRPTIYYTHNRKAFKKVSSIPLTIRQDLHQFFSGSSGSQ